MEIYQENTEFIPHEIACPTCRKVLKIEFQETKIIACSVCYSAINLDENQEILDVKKIPFNDLLAFFPDNISVKEMVAARKERNLTRVIWLLMFIILLIVSWIMY